MNGSVTMERQDIFTFESFQAVWGFYGYNNDLPEMIEKDFSRMKGLSYSLINFTNTEILLSIQYFLACCVCSHDLTNLSPPFVAFPVLAIRLTFSKSVRCNNGVR